MKTLKLIFIYAISLMILAACGGGESLTREETDTNDGNNDGSDTAVTLTLAMSILDEQGAEQTVLSEFSPLNVNVLVTDQAGAPVSGQVVTYVLSATELASFNNDTGTGLTNSDGIATIQMTVGTLSGSGTVTASVEDATPITKGFQSTGVQQAAPSTLELYANAIQLASSGNDQVELIAVVKNEQNVLLEGVTVNFSVNQNAALSNINSVTGADGTARATLDTRNNNENRTITVTATSAQLTQTLNIEVVGTEVNLNGASSVIINDTAPITIVLSDSDGNGIANQVVNLSATLGSLDVVNPVTGENGQVTVNFNATEAGTSVISAQALNATTQFEITIQQDDFSFIDLPSDSLALNTDFPLRLRWFKNNLAFANGSVTVTTSRGNISLPDGSDGNTVITDANGIASVNINSAFAGPASISAVGEDADGNEVTARASIEFVASTVDSIFVDATPDLIGPEGQTTTITAVLRDAAGNLVKGKIVNFSLVSDSSGGSISPNTAITDSNGIASSVYTSNAVSGDSGVTVAAQSDNVTSTTDLTVGDRAFDISLGTGNIIESPDPSTYLKEFSVFVTDASGRPVANAELTATVIPTLENSHEKGIWVWDEDNSFYVSVSTVPEPCDNEDTNQNGRLDDGEDFNANGLLTPGNVSSISFKDNISRTDEFGQATLQIRYPKQFGRWATVLVSVFGQSAGSESAETQVYQLGVAADDLTTRAVPPQNSPFGTGTSCGDAL